MRMPSPDLDAAFRSLEAALARRRLSELDPLLRAEVLAIAALVAGFVFWQSRLAVAFAASGEHGSALAALGALGMRIGVLLVIGAALAGTALHRTLTTPTPGPTWLALPVPPHRILRHLRGIAMWNALWVSPALAGVLVSGYGLVPHAWLLLGAAVTVWLLLESTRVACAMAWRAALLAVLRPDGVAPAAALLAHAAVVPRRSGRPAAGWRNEPAWGAFLRHDARKSLAAGVVRGRVWPALIATALAALVWAVPGARPFAHVAGFALSLIAAALFTSWLIALVDGDPPSVLRPLPAGLGAVWGARVVWAALAAVTLVAAQAGAATALDPPSHRLFSFWIGAAVFLIAVLGVNYAVSLYPRRAEADRLFSLSLGVSLAASVMIPMMGWLVLLTAVLHSLRRVPRWRTPEDP